MCGLLRSRKLFFCVRFKFVKLGEGNIEKRDELAMVCESDETAEAIATTVTLGHHWVGADS